MLDLIPRALREPILGASTAFFVVLVVYGSMLIGKHNSLPHRQKMGLPLNSLKTLSDSPILRVQLARNEEDLCWVLIPGDMNSNLAEARRGNDLDTFLFIPAYAGFLIAFGLLLALRDEPWRIMILVVGLGFVPMVAVCDWTENCGISSALNHFSQYGTALPGDAAHIWIPSLVKWSLTAVVLLTFGIASLRRVWKRLSRLTARRPSLLRALTRRVCKRLLGSAERKSSLPRALIGRHRWFLTGRDLAEALAFALLGLVAAALGCVIVLTLVRYGLERSSLMQFSMLHAFPPGTLLG